MTLVEENCLFMVPKNLPKVVEYFSGFGPLANVDDPAAAVFVPLVLPHGPDVLLEKGVVTARAQLGHLLNVVVHAPKVLHSIEVHQLKRKFENTNQKCQ